MEWNLHRHRDLLTGFFVVSALLVFLSVLAFLLARKGVFELRFTLHAVFDNGIGLREGADVLYNGVPVGRVEGVKLLGQGGEGSSGGRVVLHLRMERKYQPFITTHSVAFALRDKNLVSDRVINIETSAPGGTVLESGDTLQVSDSRDIETVLSGLTRLMGKMDELLGSIGQVVAMARDSGSSVGAMLGSRELYDRVLTSLEGFDGAVQEGRTVLGKASAIEDQLSTALPSILTRADSTALLALLTVKEVEKLGLSANRIARKGEVVLDRLDGVLAEGSAKVDQAGEVMDAVSGLWPLKSKLRRVGNDPAEYPVLLRESQP